MIHFKLIIVLLWIVGSAFILAGAWGGMTLYRDSQHYERTTGKVIQTHVERAYYRHKKRYRHEMTIGYPTARYGTLSTSLEYYCPFRKVGDLLVVWYHPDHPRDIHLPRSEGIQWGVLAVVGMMFVGIGILGWKKRTSENKINNPLI